MSFARNTKRVAGPTFNVNVRYDDHQIAVQKSANNVHQNLTSGLRLPELFDVKEAELLVTMSGDHAAKYFDGYTHCFSCVNGFKDSRDMEDLEAEILSKVKFVGVALTEYVPKPGLQEQGFVAQVGGVVTVTNESGKPISPGQKLALGINLDWARKVTRDRGIPREKIRFTIKPAKPTDKAIKDARDAVGNTDGSLEADKAFLDAYAKENQMIIGTAVSGGRPGDRVDIVLGVRTTY